MFIKRDYGMIKLRDIIMENVEDIQYKVFVFSFVGVFELYLELCKCVFDYILEVIR